MSDIKINTESTSSARSRLSREQWTTDQTRLKLIDDYLHGTLSPENAEILLHLVEENPETAQFFRENVQADYLLGMKFSLQKDLLSSSAENETEETPLLTNRTEKVGAGRHARSFFRLASGVSLLTSAAGLLVLFLFAYVGWAGYQTDDFPSVTALENKSQIIGTVKAVTPAGQIRFKTGQWLSDGRYSLASGLIRLRLFCGAELILQGPAEFEPAGIRQMVLYYGKGSCIIPPDAGDFRLMTPRGIISGPGCILSFDVTNENTTVHPVSGTPALARLTGASFSPAEGNTVALNEDGGIHPVSFQEGLKIDSAFFEEQSRQATEELLVARKERNRRIDANFHLRLRLDFNQTDLKTVINQAPFGVPLCRQARIIGCRAEEGSISGTKAIRISGQNDIVRCTLSDTCRSMTLVTTVRLDTLSEVSKNIFFSTGIPRNENGFRFFSWHIKSDGALVLRVNETRNSYTTRWRFPEEYLGTWTTLALVIDGVKNRILFYADGRQVANMNWKSPVPIQLGRVSLGGIPGSKKERFLAGAMEEFLLFDRPLSAKEIAELER